MNIIARSAPVEIPLGELHLNGDLIIPSSAHGIVLFAHGSGSSRHSSRNQFVAAELNHAGLATLLFDLLTESEEQAERFSRHLRFDITLLAQRLAAATDWIAEETHFHNIGYFGASTGGAAALVAASTQQEIIHAVVSRGGRPDLAADALPHVHAPTLLIVGGNDETVIHLNSIAYQQLQCIKRFEIIPGASHLFEEPGALETVAQLAADWFQQHLVTTVSHVSETAKWTQRNI